MEILFYISKISITFLYITCIVLLCIFGINRFYLIYLYYLNSGRKVLPGKKYKKLPKVTVQLPVYNERYVIERIIKSACMLDYPRDLIEIQVLDDSTDDTSIIAKNLVEKFYSEGINISYIKRNSRIGYKAGALEYGLEKCNGELIAIFDADFIPPKDFLYKTVHYFTNSEVGIVQTRWGHINRNYSTLTIAQSILLDGHFAIEQNSRFFGGYFLNFNGTAGLIRKQSIFEAGGWQHDSLTEDLDLSYRIQLKGWKTVYLNDVVVDGELPVDINSFKSQQHRWAKGGTQTALKLMPQIIKSKNLKFRIKLESMLHLLSNFAYPLLLILILLMLPMTFSWQDFGWQKVIIPSLLAVTAGTVSIFNFYITAINNTAGKSWSNYHKYIPLAIALGSSLVINNTKAVIEALTNKRTEFIRTPKFAVVDYQLNFDSIIYKSSHEIIFMLEFLLGMLFFTKTIYAFFIGYYSWIPFLLIIQFGFFYSSILSILHRNNIYDTFTKTSFNNIFQLIKQK